MNYLIVGAGGTGGCIGGYLAASGKDVTLIARGEHLRAIREKGLIIHGTPKGELCLRGIRACTAEEYTGKADVIFVCVKGYAVEGILPLIQKAAHTRTIVIPILNVVGTGERMATSLDDITVLDGCIYIVAHISAPGEITQSGTIFRVIYGERDGDKHRARLEQIADDLRESGIKVVVSDNIRRDAFRKYLFISPFAAAGAYYDIPAGEMQKPGEKRALFIGLLKELIQIADASGFVYPKDMVEENVTRLDMVAPDTTASMQKDLKKGGQSEIDGLVYEPVRLADRLGVAAPLYRKVAGALGYQPD